MAAITAPPSTVSIFQYPPNFPSGVVNDQWIAWFKTVQANTLVYPSPVAGYALGWDAGGNLVNVPNTGADQTAVLADTTLATNGAGRIGYNGALSYAANTAGSAIAARIIGTDLSDATTATKGAGLVGFLSSLTYAAGTVGAFLKALMADTGSTLIGYLAPYTGAVGRTQQSKNEDTVSVFDFMTPAQITDVQSNLASVDVTAGIQAAIDSLPLNTADTGVLSPKGFANGGTIQLPRGRYKVTGPITLRRGLRLIGESRESTQIISFTTGSVLLYDDAGRYIADEIIIENLSIWQDASVVATSGAAIECFLGTANPEAVALTVKNVYIEGTYRGVLLGAGIGCTLDQVTTNGAALHGFDIRYTNAGTGTDTSTTSTTLRNCYAYLCGDSGFRIERGAYCSFVSCASDSNTNYGYKVENGLGHSFVACGAEGNGVAGAYFSGTYGCLWNGYITYDTTATDQRHGVILNAAYDTTILSGRINGQALAAGSYGVHVAVNGGRVTILGTTFYGSYAGFEIDTTTLVNFTTASGGMLGNGDHWSLGVANNPETDTRWAIKGSAASGTTIGQKTIMTHTSAGATRNTQLYTQFASDNTAVTYPLVIGHFIPNASKGAAATHTRVAGEYIAEQTTGGTANANIMIDAGAGTVPAGNWNMYSDSTRPNYFKGPFTWVPLTSATPANNGDMTFELTSNTSLKIKVKGSDGTVRSVTLTLA